MAGDSKPIGVDTYAIPVNNSKAVGDLKGREVTATEAEIYVLAHNLQYKLKELTNKKRKVKINNIKTVSNNNDSSEIKTLQVLEYDSKETTKTIHTNNVITQNGKLPHPVYKFFLNILKLFFRVDLSEKAGDKLLAPYLAHANLKGKLAKGVNSQKKFVEESIDFNKTQLIENDQGEVITSLQQAKEEYQEVIADISSRFTSFLLPELSNNGALNENLAKLVEFRKYIHNRGEREDSQRINALLDKGITEISKLSMVKHKISYYQFSEEDNEEMADILSRNFQYLTDFIFETEGTKINDSAYKLSSVSNSEEMDIYSCSESGFSEILQNFCKEVAKSGTKKSLLINTIAHSMSLTIEQNEYGIKIEFFDPKNKGTTKNIYLSSAVYAQDINMRNLIDASTSIAYNMSEPSNKKNGTLNDERRIMIYDIPLEATTIV